jgi:serine/threonine protein kinase
LGHLKGSDEKVCLFHGGRWWYSEPEVCIQSQFTFPGVARLIGFGYDDRELGVFTVEEFAPLGSLADITRARLADKLPPGVTATTFSKVVFGVAATMSRIHALHIIHARLQPSFVLINSRGEPLVTGFGLSRFDSEEITYYGDWFPGPFIIYCYGSQDDVRESMSSEIFAFAMILYSIFTDTWKFAGKRPMNAAGAAVRSRNGYRYPRPEGVPDPLWTLICDCWELNPDDGPSFEEITERIRNSDDYILPGTDMREYDEYRRVMMRPPAPVPPPGVEAVLAQLRSLGLEIYSLGPRFASGIG